MLLLHLICKMLHKMPTTYARRSQMQFNRHQYASSNGDGDLSVWRKTGCVFQLPARYQWSCSWWNPDDRERRWLWCSTWTSRTSTAKCRSWYRARAQLSTCPEPRRIWKNLCPSAMQCTMVNSLLVLWTVRKSYIIFTHKVIKYTSNFYKALRHHSNRQKPIG